MISAADLFLFLAFIFFVIQFRFLSVPMHVDCSNLRYPGLMLAKGEIDHREFAIMTGHLGNKIAIFYFNLLAYILFPNLPNAGPKIFYLLYTSLTALTVYKLFSGLLSVDAACFAVLFYLLLNFYPRLYTYYDSIEKYGHLPTFLLLGWAFDNTPTTAFLAGFAGPILFFLFKPTYILEWLAAAAWLAVKGQILFLAGGGACGMIFICLVAIARRGDLRELAGYCKKLHLNGNLLYFLKFRNVGARFDKPATEKTRPNQTVPDGRTKKTKTSRPALYFLAPLLPVLVFLAYCWAIGINGMPAPQRFLFLPMLCAAIAALVLQFRFFGYHFLPLIPYGVAAGTYAWNSAAASWQQGLLWAFMGLLILASSRFFLLTDEGINKILFKKIPHYQHRNIASVKIAKHLRGEKIRSLLQWDEGRHVNVLLGIPTPAGNDEVAPWSYSLYPAKGEAMINGCRHRPPEILLPMINNINWQTFTALTGLHFQKDKAATVIVDNEVFPLYRLDQNRPRQIPDENNGSQSLMSELFIPCRCVTKDQRRIWNSIRHECHAQ